MKITDDFHYEWKSSQKGFTTFLIVDTPTLRTAQINLKLTSLALALVFKQHKNIRKLPISLKFTLFNFLRYL